MTVQDGPRWSIDPAQRPVVAGDGRRYTNMYETRNETEFAPRLWRGTDPSDLTFRFPGGFPISSCRC